MKSFFTRQLLIPGKIIGSHLARDDIIVSNLLEFFFELILKKF